MISSEDRLVERRRSSILPVTPTQVKQITEEKVEKVAHRLLEHKDYPWMTALTLLQIMLFSMSLSLVRFIANVHWWQDNMIRPLTCLIIVSFCAPMFGLLLGQGIPRFSMVLARTEFMQERNVHWVSVILEDHVTGRDQHCRQSSRRITNTKRRSSAFGTVVSNASGHSRKSSRKGRASLLNIVTSLTTWKTTAAPSSTSQGSTADMTLNKTLASIQSSDEEDSQSDEIPAPVKDVHSVRQQENSSGSNANAEQKNLPGMAAKNAD